MAVTKKTYIGKCWLEMFRSLCIAVDEAGGSPPTLEELSKWSAWDFFHHYATNGVRFVHDKEGKLHG